MKRTYQAIKAGDLFSLPESQKFNPKAAIVQVPTKHTKPEPITRVERMVFNPNTEALAPLKAIYPLLTAQAEAATMDNYRLFVADYNERIKQLNADNEKINAAVRKNKVDKGLTEVQKTFSDIFIKKNFKKTAKQYNELAEAFNQEYGLVIELKKYQTIKYQTEMVFRQMLHLYCRELSKHTEYFMKLGLAHEKTIIPYEVNSFHVVELVRNNVKSIDICTKTVRNHRDRLEEAGVFCSYQFQGYIRPNTKTQKQLIRGVKMHLNPQILVIFDAKNNNLITSENQRLTPRKGKELPNNNEVTRAFKKNIKKIENGQADFLDKERSIAAGFSFVFYKDIPQQEAKSKLGGGEKNVKISKTLSEKLEKSILPEQELAVQLSAGTFNNYTRIDKRYLEQEAYNGTMSREDFKLLVIQEFFKCAARLYRDKNVFVGSWKKAINSYIEKLFFTNNGNGLHLYNKSLMIEQLDQLMWRLNTAAKWFRKTNISPLFPSDYFDFSRVEAKEIGFEYTKKSWINHLKYIETKPAQVFKIKKKADLRKKTINHSKKFDVALNRFFKNRLQLSELIEYVDKNLPAEYLQKLSDRLIKLSNSKYTC